MAKEKLPDETGPAFLKSARDIAFIMAIYLYFSGWVYIYTYFNAFGISIRQTEMEFYYFIVYSVNVITFLVFDHWFITACSVLTSIILINRVKKSWFIYAMCIFLFGALYYCSILAGIADSRKDFSYRGSRLLRIKFTMKQSATTANTAPINKAGTLKLTDTATCCVAAVTKPVYTGPLQDENIDSIFNINNKTEI